MTVIAPCDFLLDRRGSVLDRGKQPLRRFFCPDFLCGKLALMFAAGKESCHVNARLCLP